MICVLTYNAPHRKTQDLLGQLKANGVENLMVLGTPWVERKNYQPLIYHRPEPLNSILPTQLCRNLGYNYRVVSHDALADTLKQLTPKALLIAGAGILPSEIVNSITTINAHPGYLPYVRGLDALKWAIWEDHPIGATLHVVNNTPDAGYLIEQKLLPLSPTDTFHSLAYRLYELEIALLASAPFQETLVFGTPLPELGEVHKRMPRSYEFRLYQKLDEYLNRRLTHDQI